MALLLTEGCDSGLDRWTVNNSVTVDSSSSNFGTDCFRFANNAGSMFNSIRKDLEQNYLTSSFVNPEVRTSFWLKVDTNAIVANTVFLRFSDYSSNVDWGLDVWGRLQSWQIRQNYTTGTLAANASTMPSIADNNWHFIEIFDRRRSTGTTNGEIQLWVDRTNYVSSTSATGFSYNNSTTWNRPVYLQIGNVTGANLFIDDIVVWNSLSNTYNANTTTNNRIYTLRPIFDDAISNTSVSQGTLKYPAIREANANSQTYVSIGDVAKFNMSDINVKSNILGAIVVTKFGQINAGHKFTVTINTQTNFNSINGTANTYFSGQGTKENLTFLNVPALGNSSVYINSLKVEIKKT